MKNFNRHSIRLKGFDYSSNGMYFVTICTKDREYLFGDIVNGKMVLNGMGQVINQVIQKTTKIRKNVQIDIYQIMPNHVHIIVIISNRRGVLHTPQDMNPSHYKGEFNSPLQSPSQTLGSIIRGIKSMTTKQIRIITGNFEFPVWQRNYFEHIIRNEIELLKIRDYIKLNPAMWERDRNNLKNDNVVGAHHDAPLSEIN